MALSQAAGSSQSHKLTNKHYAVSTPSALQEASHFLASDLGADEQQLELDEDDCIDGLTGHQPHASAQTVTMLVAARRSTYTVPFSRLERPRGAAAVWLVVGFVF